MMGGWMAGGGPRRGGGPRHQGAGRERGAWLGVARYNTIPYQSRCVVRYDTHTHTHTHEHTQWNTSLGLGAVCYNALLPGGFWPLPVISFWCTVAVLAAAVAVLVSCESAGGCVVCQFSIFWGPNKFVACVFVVVDVLQYQTSHDVFIRSVSLLLLLLVFLPYHTFQQCVID